MQDCFFTLWSCDFIIAVAVIFFKIYSQKGSVHMVNMQSKSGQPLLHTLATTERWGAWLLV